MSINPLTLKLAVPYARAIFDHIYNQDILYSVSKDFQTIEILLKNDELKSYLNNPLVSNKQKEEILNKILESKVHFETLTILTILIKRNRINLLEPISQLFFEYLFQQGKIKTIEVETAFPLTSNQQKKLIEKLTRLTNSSNIRLFVQVNRTLIGGFLIKTQSKKIDFTIKNNLQKLSEHLDSVIDL